MARFDLTDLEWSAIEPLLPTNTPSIDHMDYRRVLNGIFWRLRTGAPWSDIPERYGPHATCSERFRQWRKVGLWDRLLKAVQKPTKVGFKSMRRASILTSTPPTQK